MNIVRTLLSSKIVAVWIKKRHSAAQFATQME